MFSELRIQDTGDTKYKMVWILHEPKVSFLSIQNQTCTHIDM